MGTIKQGILGGFSGKVGTVIGSSWKGISYMRGRAQSVKNPRTEGQVEQRSKFALTLDFLKPITAYVRTGYKTYASKQTAFNAAMSYIVKNAVSGAFPNYALDFSRVLVSRGSLTQPSSPNVSMSASRGTTTAVRAMPNPPMSQCRWHSTATRAKQCSAPQPPPVPTSPPN